MASIFSRHLLGASGSSSGVRGWYTTLYVSRQVTSDHTLLRVTRDVELLLTHLEEGERDWIVAMIVGPFRDEESAIAFMSTWKEQCRGLVSRVARGEALARLRALHAYADFKVILRDERAYDYITVLAQS